MKKIYTLLIIFIISTCFSFSEENIKKTLPKLLGVDNAGREFYFTFIPCWESSGPNNKLKIYITSNVKTKVKVEVTGKGYEETKYTIPNDIIEFTLTPDIGQPYTKTDRDVPEPEQVWTGAGIHVTADEPVICYGVTRYQYTSDGFLAYPVENLGKAYQVASYADPASNTIQWLSSYSGITAAYDKTKVLFTMGGNEWSTTAGGLMPGQSKSWTLNKSDVLLVASLGQHADLSGSTIIATKPVSVVSGNFCAYIPTNCGCCDIIEEMETPTSAWASSYHVAPIDNRRKNSFIKIFAKEAKTKIYRDYEQIGFIRTSGGVEGNGHLHMRAAEGDVRPVVISGDKPISVTQYNSGQLDDNVESDPSQMVLLPVGQYQEEAIFCTPGIKGGLGFNNNYINIIYESDIPDSIPDDLELAYYDDVDSIFKWYKLNDSIASPATSFAENPGGKQYAFTTYKLPGDNVYRLKAEKPFQAYAYGFSWCDAYGFPVSASLKDPTNIDTLPPEPEWIIDCVGLVNFDKRRYVVDKPDDPDIRSNLSTIYMHRNQSYNFKLYHEDFMPCEDPFTGWSMEVIDNSKDAYAVVTFADCAGNDTTLFIEYFAPKFDITPKNLYYDISGLEEPKDKIFYLVNLSETSEAKIWYMMLKQKDEKSNDQGFSLWDSTGTKPITKELSPPLIIPPSDSIPFIVRFEATKKGDFTDSIGIADTCFICYKTQVRATVGWSLISASDCNFYDTKTGEHDSCFFYLMNYSNKPLIIHDISGPSLEGIVSGEKIFYSKDIEQYRSNLPDTLLHTESKRFYIFFKPDDQLDYSDSIVFISNTIKDTSLNNGNPIDSVCILSGKGVIVDVPEENEIKDINVVPNPADDKLIIKTNENISDISIIDLMGFIRECKLNIGDNYSVINVSNLPNGMYILKINSGYDIITSKFIIQR